MLRNVAPGLPVCLLGKLSFWVPIGGDGGHNTAHQEPVRLQRPKIMTVRARALVGKAPE